MPTSIGESYNYLAPGPGGISTDVHRGSEINLLGGGGGGGGGRTSEIAPFLGELLDGYGKQTISFQICIVRFSVHLQVANYGQLRSNGRVRSTQTLVIHQWAGLSVIAKLAPDSTPDRAE